MEYITEKFLTLQQLSNALQLDPRTVKKLAWTLGGRRIGYRWRFKLSTVLEIFDNAKFENGQRKPMDGPSCSERQASSLQILSSRKKIRPRMESRQRMGGRTKKNSLSWDSDSYGLGAAYGVGAEIS